MTKGDFLAHLANFAIDYHKQAPESVVKNSHMNKLDHDDDVEKEVSDAVIVDFINYIGTRMGVDYAMYTTDLTGEKRKLSAEK
jgi:hypothetical protein